MVRAARELQDDFCSHPRDAESKHGDLHHGTDAAIGHHEGERLLPGVGGAAGHPAVQRQDRAPLHQVQTDPIAGPHVVFVVSQSPPGADLLPPQDPPLDDLVPECSSHRCRVRQLY